MTVNLALATVDHAAAISAIMSAWIDETPWMPRVHARAQHLDFGNWLISVTDVTIALDGKYTVGFLSRRDQDIQALYLDASHRNGGTGALLIEHAKAQAEKLGLWTFRANLGAQKFYLRNGFLVDGETDGQGNDEKLPDLHMTWQRGGHE